MLRLGPCVLLLTIGAAAGNQAAITHVREYWEANFQPNDRALMVARGVGEDNGADKIKAMCFTKGSGKKGDASAALPNSVRLHARLCAPHETCR